MVGLDGVLENHFKADLQVIIATKFGWDIPDVFQRTGEGSIACSGRVGDCICSIFTISQAEISGEQMEPFMVDMEVLTERSTRRTPADTEAVFRRIFKGSMPAIVSGQNSNSQIFYSSYLSTYIERDIRELSGSIDSLKFLKFITAVAARCGQMLNMADIAQDADINQKQVKDWLGILENYVVAEIRKTYLNCGKEPFMYYYRDKDAKEIDIVLEHDGPEERFFV